MVYETWHVCQVYRWYLYVITFRDNYFSLHSVLEYYLKERRLLYFYVTLRYSAITMCVTCYFHFYLRRQKDTKVILHLQSFPQNILGIILTEIGRIYVETFGIYPRQPR